MRNDPDKLDAVPAEQRAGLQRMGRVLALQQGVDMAAVAADHLQRCCRALQQPGESLVGLAERLERDRDVCERLAQALRPRGTLLDTPEHLDAFVDWLRDEVATGRACRVWVPACRDGLDVALLALWADAAGLLPHLTVYGTDVSSSADRTRRGPDLYLLAPALSEPMRQRLVRDGEGAGLRLPPELLKSCSFIPQQLFDIPSFGGIDLVMARDIAILLLPGPRRRLLERLHAALAPNGLLWVATNESGLVRGDLFGDADDLAGVALFRALERRRGQSAPSPDAAQAALGGAFELARDPMAVLTADGVISAVNPVWRQRVSHQALLQIGTPLSALLRPSGDLSRLPLPAAGVTERVPCQMALVHGDGAVVLDLMGQADGSVLVQVRIEESSTRRELDQLREQLRHVASLLREAVVVTDAQGTITQFPGAASRLAVWTENEALGQPLERVLRIEDVNGDALDWRAEGPLAGQSLPLRRERVAVLGRDGNRVWVRLDAHLLHSGDRVSGAVVILSDISAHLALSEELSFRSAHDPLTGLMSREQFERELGELIDEAQTAPGVQHAMAYIDLDQFKVINDTLGHFAGDELLRQLAREYKGLLRASDRVARLGGDEFGVLMPHCSVTQARPLADEILEATREFRFVWEARSYGMTASIGLIGISEQTVDVGTVLADADAICFMAKEAGRDRVQVAGGGDDVARRRNEMALLAKINRALDQNLFELHYQDVVSSRAPERVAYRELLVRMRDEDEPGALVSPGLFIPAAERYSLMGAIDRWVINAALAGIARCPDDDVLYAINISGVSINDASFLRHVEDALTRHAVAPARVCFEITETAAIAQLDEARAFIERLVALGCCFALDDFGVGMSSFAYLKHLPIRFLKIDGSFVRAMLSNHVDRGMVEAINRIGHEMQLETIGEHVENLELLAAIAEVGVDYAQGWGIAAVRPFVTLQDGG
jgi:diguanylate cyclase (GGDEF)-like protein/PAS domain S-box-containing protein